MAEDIYVCQNLDMEHKYGLDRPCYAGKPGNSLPIYEPNRADLRYLSFNKIRCCHQDKTAPESPAKGISVNFLSNHRQMGNFSPGMGSNFPFFTRILIKNGKQMGSNVNFSF